MVQFRESRSNRQRRGVFIIALLERMERLFVVQQSPRRGLRPPSSLYAGLAIFNT